MGDNADDREQDVMPDGECIRTILFAFANAVGGLLLVMLLIDPRRR